MTILGAHLTHGFIWLLPLNNHVREYLLYEIKHLSNYLVN